MQPTLTRLERNVIRLREQGLSYAQIAYELRLVSTRAAHRAMESARKATDKFYDLNEEEREC